jgi:carboxypeptidase PM20D1
MACASDSRLADRLARLIRVPTISRRDGRDEAAFHDFRSLLAEMYPLTHQHLEHELVSGGSILFRWPGTTGPTILLMAHYDVVPVDGQEWSRAPFSGEVEGGAVHGRGTLDDKGTLFVILEAVESLLADGFAPTTQVYLSFGDDEEVGGSHAGKVAEALKTRGVTPDVVIDEGGAVVSGMLPMVSGELAMIGITEKGMANVVLTARNQGGHASAPPKNGATAQLAAAILALERNPFPSRSNPVIVEMIKTLTSRMPRWLRPIMTARVVKPLIPPAMSRVGETTGALVRTTVAVTMLSGSSAPNVLPNEASATLNIRIAPGETLAATRARLSKILRGTGVEISACDGSDPAPVSSTTGASFARIKAALAKSHPLALAVPYVMVQSSDSRHMAPISKDIYRFMPFRISADQLASIHGADEHIDVSALSVGVEFYRQIIAGT